MNSPPTNEELVLIMLSPREEEEEEEEIWTGEGAYLMVEVDGKISRYFSECERLVSEEQSSSYREAAEPEQRPAVCVVGESLLLWEKDVISQPP